MIMQSRLYDSELEEVASGTAGAAGAGWAARSTSVCTSESGSFTPKKVLNIAASTEG